ncbi:TetR/AcrR family transcriptional regulator [Streptomyces endophyticus]|uniref:TetR/AcrR family transcriptional regulator n=1 Tax=Streptomyces endophyticus TaxID=714166 RepID=A0ABU6F304_9ACTN|nr:helix-turn-helix domain-containing protein [Streptomyces endophyticus]MEB8338392.1 TetR/AcrR family transcriptional regulator [Streptomyces endophyticus]
MADSGNGTTGAAAPREKAVKKTVKKAAMDSEATSRLLEHAALELIERDGVLAGLNLREVADRAGVNRGLVYHYFGSRRDLLRAALQRTAAERRERLLVEEGPRRFGDRVARSVRGCVRLASSVRLLMLLMLDGDTKLRAMPLRERTQERLRTDIDSGYVAGDVDPVALHAFLQSVNYGYVLTRSSLAKEFGIGVRDLDERFVALLERMSTGVDGPAAAADDDAGQASRSGSNT